MLRGHSLVLGSRGERMKAKLMSELSPAELAIEDVSYQHAGVRGTDRETHFNVKVVSGKFEGKSLVKRHRLIYELLQEESQSGLHALSIVAMTPSEVNRWGTAAIFMFCSCAFLRGRFIGFLFPKRMHGSGSVRQYA